LHLGDVAVQAIGASDHAGDRGDDSIEARRGVIAKLDVGIAGGKGVVHLEDFNYNRIMCRACRLTSIAAWIEELVVFTMVH
jgi:hypothetical protein